jgi:muskelin
LHQLSEASLFETYLRSRQPYSSWKKLTGTNADGDVPSPRSGHAMCIDHQNGLVYLFGGWDGEKSLDDFWVYDTKEDRWRILSYRTGPERNAPGARSCHKMVFDHKTGSIYVLGRLSDEDTLKPSGETTRRTGAALEPEDDSICSEFYRYHTRGADRGKWDFLAFDTAVSRHVLTLAVRFYILIAASVIWGPAFDF